MIILSRGTYFFSPFFLIYSSFFSLRQYSYLEVYKHYFIDDGDPLHLLMEEGTKDQDPQFSNKQTPNKAIFLNLIFVPLIRYYVLI